MSYDEHLISQAGGDGEPLEAIQRRADRANEGWRLETKDQANADREYLLALVREQAAKLDLLTMALEEADEDCCCGVCGL